MHRATMILTRAAGCSPLREASRVNPRDVTVTDDVACLRGFAQAKPAAQYVGSRRLKPAAQIVVRPPKHGTSAETYRG